jgi:DNA anti-recombination protein RmuC
MKQSILTITACAFMAGAVLTSCNSSAEKVENAEQDVKDAKAALDQANEEYLLDIENYRLATADKIETNNQSIADFNLRIENEKKEAKAAYQKQITELEQKNSDMKKKLEDYNAEGKENWEKFKYEFSRDMDELGEALKNLTVKNTK